MGAIENSRNAVDDRNSMKGPQKSCCRDYAKRKLSKLVKKGDSLGAQFVTAKLRGMLKTFPFEASCRESAESFFNDLSRSTELRIKTRNRSLNPFVEDDDNGRKKKKFEVVVLMREVP